MSNSWMRQRPIDPVHDLTVMPQELALHIGVGGQQGSVHRGHSSSTNEEMLYIFKHLGNMTRAKIIKQGYDTKCISYYIIFALE